MARSSGLSGVSVVVGAWTLLIAATAGAAGPFNVNSTGTILKDVTKGRIGGEAYDRELPERVKQTLY